VEVEAAGSQGRLPKVWEGIAFKKRVMAMIMKQEQGHTYGNNINKALLYGRLEKTDRSRIMQ
jgi:hypothetical protein